MPAAPALSMEITAAAGQVKEENYNTCDQLFP